MRSLPRLKELATVVVVIITGLVLSSLAGVAAWTTERDRQTQEIAHQGEMVGRVISDTLDLAVTQVRSLQAFFAASDQITAAEFGRFGFFQGASPGMVALGYAPVVTADRFDDLQERVENERLGYVLIDNGRRVIDEAPRDRPLVPVWFAYQFNMLPSILGLDLNSDPVRRSAIAEARTRARPVVSEVVDVLGATDREYVDIYGAVDNDTHGGAGIVFASLALADLVGAETRAALPGIDLRISSLPEETPAPISEPARWSDTFEVQDQQWLVTLVRSDATGIPPLSLLTMAAGLAITASAALATSVLARSRARRREIEGLRRSTRDKDVFLTSVAHELRTPLTSVVGVTALLSEEWGDLEPEEVRELLRDTHSEASDLADLIDDLLVAGRLESGTINYKLEPVDLAREVRRVATRVSTDRRLDIQLPDTGPMVAADSLRVRQIVRNLLVNATRYAETTISIFTEPFEGGVRLVVRNDGPSIPDYIADVLFEPYQGGVDDRAKQGSIGLGLPVSRRLARAMGGDLSYSHSDGWCRFTLGLPSTTVAEEDAQPTARMASRR
ncbi:MAG TPA: ATP-binding protein [Acidimicrobiia bacterium]|nr:ATP-binding protein [Acidimicrobiia bacterium]